MCHNTVVKILASYAGYKLILKLIVNYLTVSLHVLTLLRLCSINAITLKKVFLLYYQTYKLCSIKYIFKHSWFSMYLSTEWNL